MNKILIIDDEPATVEMLSVFLNLNGYEGVGAYNGSDGLVLLEAERPDMLIVDLMMPDIEGFDVCLQVRQKPTFAHTLILIISARTDQDSIRRAYACGANGYLTKPIKNLGDLLGEIQRLMG